MGSTGLPLLISNERDNLRYGIDIKVGDEWMNCGSVSLPQDKDIENLKYETIRASGYDGWATIEVEGEYEIFQQRTKRSKAHLPYIIGTDYKHPAFKLMTGENEGGQLEAYGTVVYAGPDKRPFTKEDGPDHIPGKPHFKVWSAYQSAWIAAGNFVTHERNETGGRIYTITIPGRYKIVNAATEERPTGKLAYEVTGGILISADELRKIWPTFDTLTSDKGEVIKFSTRKAPPGGWDSVLFKNYTDGMKVYNGSKGSNEYIEFFKTSQSGVAMGRYKKTGSKVVCVTEINTKYIALRELPIKVVAIPTRVPKGGHNIVYRFENEHLKINDRLVSITPTHDAWKSNSIYEVSWGRDSDVVYSTSYSAEDTLRRYRTVYMVYDGYADTVGFDNFEGGDRPKTAMTSYELDYYVDNRGAY